MGFASFKTNVCLPTAGDSQDKGRKWFRHEQLSNVFSPTAMDLGPSAIGFGMRQLFGHMQFSSAHLSWAPGSRTLECSPKIWSATSNGTQMCQRSVMLDLLDSMTSNFTKLWAPSCKSVSSDCASSGRSAQPCHKCGNLDPNCKFASLNYDHHLPKRNLHLPNLPIMGVSRSKTWLRSPKHHGGQRSRSEDFPLPLSSGHTIQDMVLRSQHCGCQRGTSAWLWMAVSSEKWCWKVERIHIDIILTNVNTFQKIPYVGSWWGWWWFYSSGWTIFSSAT